MKEDEQKRKGKIHEITCNPLKAVIIIALSSTSSSSSYSSSSSSYYSSSYSTSYYTSYSYTSSSSCSSPSSQKRAVIAPLAPTHPPRRTPCGRKPLTLQIAVPKEYNVRRHYDTNHAQVYKKYSGKARDDKVEELEQSLKQQQSLFKNVRHVSDAAVKASYIISNEIAASSRPFTEGDFVKKCMLLTADVICPDKRQAFANKREKEMHELNDIIWLKDLAFMVDITDHLNHLNIQMQGKNKLVTDFYDLIRAFEIKLQLFQRQIASHNLAHFPNLKSMQNKNNIDDGDLAEKYCEKISKLRDEFQNRFSDFKCMENEFAVFRNPFSVDVNVLPEPLQLEIIDMQCDSVLKDKFSTCQLSTFYQYVDSKYPNVKYLASKIMSMYGSTFACEQLFSVMNINKSRLRSKLSDEHLNSILKIATKSFTPNFDALVKKKRSQVSGSSSSQH
ncbi:general transcription factor II-I repeat domain-containing protein 2B-like [Macrobrachium rosenbergii]|uniref:general transcription factor II-I repeat domain-containing protein 2B-like n=2 Tax=Macrobrachium rosenbergii TaxID=79674 RepID=UPI0034D70F09